MITINSNSSATIAQQNLYASQAALNDNMLQLSTGMRINSASDDAAGLQITNRMETQISGLDQAQRNTNDAISMAQTAEGAMDEMTDILNRARDLNMQANNDNYASADVAAMQEEVDALGEELGDIVSRTDFAGVQLLDGTHDSFTFQVGADAGDTIEIEMTDMTQVLSDLSTGTTDLNTATSDQIAGNITAIDTALAEIDEARASLGADINRLESKNDNLSNVEQNMMVSQSRMLDADFAQQTTEMTSNQMLMQAGTSVLGQANSMPQYAVQLMG